MSTTEGWVGYMYLAGATKGIGIQPERENNFWVPIFFIIFILFGSLFILNLFVGVVIGTFNNEKETIGKNFLLTANQKEWIDTQMLILNVKPRESKQVRQQIYKSKTRRLLLRIVDHSYFETFIMSCIILNTIVLCLHWYDQPHEVSTATEYLNYIFFGVFFIEA